MTHRTLIVPAAHVDLARSLAAGLTSAGVGMWATGLSASGAPPATHFISAGEISEEFAALLADPAALHAACVAAGAQVTRKQVDDLLAASVISDGTCAATDKDGKPVTVHEDAHGTIERLGLKFVQGPPPGEAERPPEGASPSPASPASPEPLPLP